MGYSVLGTDSFERNYNRAIGYLRDKGSPAAAKRLSSELARIASILEATPFINAVSRKEYLAHRDLREHFFMNYALVYKVDGDNVILVNLFHQTQDYQDVRYWRDDV